MTEQTRNVPQERLDLIIKFINAFHLLPESVIVRIFQHLDYSGRSCLALTCKDNARIAVEHALLDSSDPMENLAWGMNDFLFHYQRDYPEIEFCKRCRLFKTRDKDFWRKRILAELNNVGGADALKYLALEY